MNNYLPEIIFSSFFLFIGISIGRFFNAGQSQWYSSLVKPSFNPPGWIFSPVWTILYILMGILFARLWRHKDENRVAIALFILQMILNFLWTPLFFYFHTIDLAFLDCTMLLISIIALAWVLRNKRNLVLLILPYLAWVSFATLLNFMIYKMNSL